MNNNWSEFYDKKLVYKYMLVILLFIALMMATKGLAAILLLILLVFYALMRKPEKLLFMVLMSSSFMMMNGALIPKGFVSVVSIKVQMVLSAFLLAGHIFGRKHPNVLTPLLGILFYLIYMIVPSSQGWCPPISFLKLFLFTIVFFSYYGCAIMVMNSAAGDAKTLRSMMLAMSIIFVFGSLAVYPIPSISQMDYALMLKSNVESYYQGVTNHSQALGVLMAMFGVMIYADMVFNLQKGNKLYIALIIVSAILIYMAACRTAMASLVAGICFSTFIAMNAKGVKRTWRGKVVSAMLMIVTIASLAVLVIPSTRNKAVQFVVKHGGEEGPAQLEGTDVFMSRRGKWDMALYNWKQKPAIGNGFQVSEEMVYKRVDGIRDMLSAPIEKGTWTYAILEEGGVVGLTLFLLFALNAFFSWFRRKAYVGMTIFFTFLMCNFGEFSLFSMSMDGGLFWFLVFFGIIIDWKRIKSRPEAMPYYRP